jgi:aspartate/methionine/tyrosine aminotransferase
VLRRGELAALAALCRDRRLTLVGDEVFSDYRLAPASALSEAQTPVSVLQQQACLACSLGGLSKSIGLPQLKLAWMAWSGPAPLVDDALERLELIGDTYLSVSTPVQLALPVLLGDGQVVRAQLLERVRANLQALGRALAGAPGCSLLEPAGGWSAVIRVPARASEEQTVLDLLEQRHVLVSPGYFYDFPFEAFIVVSLIAPPETFAVGVRRVIDAVGAP